MDKHIEAMADVRRPPCENKMYHIFNRGVEKKDIFLKDIDRARFIHDMYEFNDTAPAPKYIHYEMNKNQNISAERDQLVTVHTFCLMPNHYHLLVEEIKDGGVPLFIKKLQGGYARAFNNKYGRSGYLFQGKHKKIPVETDNQLLQLACYIHANPLDLWKSNWKESKLIKRDIEEAINFLKLYRWSSHLDYLEIKNFDSVIYKRFLNSIFNEYSDYKTCFREWLESFEKNVQEIKEFICE